MLSSQRLIGYLVIGAIVGWLGCGSSGGGGGATSGGASMDAVSSQADAQEAARKQAEQAAAAKAAEEKKAAEAQAAQAAAAPEMKKAGRSSVGPGGYYTAIVGARRHILNETESWAWKQAVQHFRATEGRKPKDHAEFMKRIVQEQGISLGYKEENQEFFYDPNAESEGDLGVVYVVEKEPAAAPADGSASPAPVK